MKLIMTAIIALIIGIAIGYFFGDDHGWERAVKRFDLSNKGIWYNSPYNTTNINNATNIKE